MPYTAEHKQQTRKRIVQSARRLFNRNGFAEVSIQQIMEEAGLTHGGFYKHFAAKEDLYREAVLEFICAAPEPWQMAHVDPSAEGQALARMIVEAYLSREHLDDLDGSCPMIALPSDVSRGNGAVKSAFRSVLDMMVEVIAGNVDSSDARLASRARTRDHGNDGRRHGAGARHRRRRPGGGAPPERSPSGL